MAGVFAIEVLPIVALVWMWDMGGLETRKWSFRWVSRNVAHR